jgi:hypothetical protein
MQSSGAKHMEHTITPKRMHASDLFPPKRMNYSGIPPKIRNYSGFIPEFLNYSFFSKIRNYSDFYSGILCLPLDYIQMCAHRSQHLNTEFV